MTRIIDDFPAIRAAMAGLRAADSGPAWRAIRLTDADAASMVSRQFPVTVIDPDWLNGVQEKMLHELAAADRSPIEPEAGPSPHLMLGIPV
jgi:hypothetical protein